MADGERRTYAYIVVGCGGVGSAALYWLAKRAGKGKQHRQFTRNQLTYLQIYKPQQVHNKGLNDQFLHSRDENNIIKFHALLDKDASACPINFYMLQVHTSTLYKFSVMQMHVKRHV